MSQSSLLSILIIEYHHMKQKIVSILSCPKCKSKIDFKEEKKSGDRVHQGKLTCKKCNKSFDIINDIVCFKTLTKKDINPKEIQKIQDLFLKEEISKKWLKYFNKHEKQELENELKWLIDNSDLKNSKIHLDWATGPGRFLRNILEVYNGEVIALDIGYPTCLGLKVLLQKLNKYANVTIICDDVRNMPFSDNSIDSASSWHGLDEPNIDKAIDESKRILKSNRPLSVSGLSFKEGSKSLKIALKWKIKFACKNEIRRYFEKVGFRDIKYATFFEGKWTGKDDFLPCFEDYFINYGISGKK